MAAVWLCDAGAGLQVAVKWLDRFDPIIQRRFALEVQTMSRIVHPRVVTVLDSGVAEGRPYLVMEYIEGVDLRVYAAKLRLRPPGERAVELRRIGIQLC
jgi:serine/threonine-protein kinase